MPQWHSKTVSIPYKPGLVFSPAVHALGIVKTAAFQSRISPVSYSHAAIRGSGIVEKQEFQSRISPVSYSHRGPVALIPVNPDSFNPV